MTVFTPADRQKPSLTTVWEQNQRKHLSFPSGSDKRYPTVTNNSAVKQKNRLSVTTVKTVVFFYRFDFYIVNENKLIWVNMWYTFNRIRQKEGNGCETAALLFWFIFLLLSSEPIFFYCLKPMDISYQQTHARFNSYHSYDGLFYLFKTICKPKL